MMNGFDFEGVIDRRGNSFRLRAALRCKFTLAPMMLLHMPVQKPDPLALGRCPVLSNRAGFPTGFRLSAPEFITMHFRSVFAVLQDTLRSAAGKCRLEPNKSTLTTNPAIEPRLA